MNLTDIVSFVAMYFGSLLFLIGAHLFSACLESGRIIKAGLKWLFWRFKDDRKMKNELFVLAFVHELISIFIFVAITILFVLALVFKNEYLVAICLPLSFIYFCYVLILQNKQAQRKKEHK